MRRAFRRKRKAPHAPYKFGSRPNESGRGTAFLPQVALRSNRPVGRDKVCDLTVQIDLSKTRLISVFNLVGDSGFHIRSVRLVPVVGSKSADVQLRLGGGSRQEFGALIHKVEDLPGILLTQHSVPLTWTSSHRAARALTTDELDKSSFPQDAE